MTTPDSTLIERLEADIVEAKKVFIESGGLGELDLIRDLGEAIDELTRLNGCLERIKGIARSQRKYNAKFTLKKALQNIESIINGANLIYKNFEKDYE